MVAESGRRDTGPFGCLGLALGPRLRPVFICVLLVLRRAVCLALGGTMFDTCPFGSCLAYSVFGLVTFPVHLASREESLSLEGVGCLPRALSSGHTPAESQALSAGG